MKAINLFWIIGLLAAFFGCQRAFSPVEYIQYVNDPENGLVKSREIDGLKVSVQYRPASYLLARDIEKAIQPDSLYTQRLSELTGSEYYHLRLAPKDGQTDVLLLGAQSKEEMELRRRFLMFDLKHHIKLVADGDTLPCQFHHYEQTYGLSPFADISLAFPQISESGDRQLILEDLAFPVGPLKFRFRQEEIAQLPQLIF